MSVTGPSRTKFSGCAHGTGTRTYARGGGWG